MKLSGKEKELLSALAKATNENGFIYLSKKDAKRLVSAGLAEVNETLAEESEDGETVFATRATVEGVELAGVELAENDGAISAFELEDGVEMPKVARGRAGKTRYPFDAMIVGQSFHVPATEAKPNPAKALASTVSGANKRYKDEDGNATRRFAVRAVDDTDNKGAGARVFRVE